MAKSLCIGTLAVALMAGCASNPPAVKPVEPVSTAITAEPVKASRQNQEPETEISPLELEPGVYEGQVYGHKAEYIVERTRNGGRYCKLYLEGARKNNLAKTWMIIHDNYAGFDCNNEMYSVVFKESGSLKELHYNRYDDSEKFGCVHYFDALLKEGQKLAVLAQNKAKSEMERKVETLLKEFYPGVNRKENKQK